MGLVLRLVTNRPAGELHSRTETQVEIAAEPQVGHKADMEAGQNTADTRMIDIPFPCDGILDRVLAIRNSESGEIHTQLETEMEEFVIHIRSVLCLLGMND